MRSCIHEHTRMHMLQVNARYSCPTQMKEAWLDSTSCSDYQLPTIANLSVERIFIAQRPAAGGWRWGSRCRITTNQMHFTCGEDAGKGAVMFMLMMVECPARDRLLSLLLRRLDCAVCLKASPLSHAIGFRLVPLLRAAVSTRQKSVSMAAALLGCRQHVSSRQQR